MQKIIKHVLSFKPKSLKFFKKDFYISLYLYSLKFPSFSTGVVKAT